MADKFFDAMFTASMIGGSSGPAPVIVAKNITANGTYSALDDQADGYNPVVVDVPNTYTAGDEGKVVSSGALVAQTSTTATANGTIDTTTNNEVVVNVPNSYTAGDEGKVVSNGALVSQTAYPTTITENGTYNTTENNSVTVSVPSSTEVVPLTTTFSDIEQIEAYIVKNSTNIYIYGLIQVNNMSGQYVTDIVFNYNSDTDVSGLDGKTYSFKGITTNYGVIGTLIVNQNNKTITFNDPTYFLLQSGSYIIHPYPSF